MNANRCIDLTRLSLEAAGSILSLGRVVRVVLHQALEADNLETGHYWFFSGPPKFRVQSLLRQKFFSSVNLAAD
jgi:hypothetical protein